MSLEISKASYLCGLLASLLAASSAAQTDSDRPLGRPDFYECSESEKTEAGSAKVAKKLSLDGSVQNLEAEWKSPTKIPGARFIIIWRGAGEISIDKDAFAGMYFLTLNRSRQDVRIELRRGKARHKAANEMAFTSPFFRQQGDNLVTMDWGEIQALARDAELLTASLVNRRGQTVDADQIDPIIFQSSQDVIRKLVSEVDKKAADYKARCTLTADPGDIIVTDGSNASA